MVTIFKGSQQGKLVGSEYEFRDTIPQEEIIFINNNSDGHELLGLYTWNQHEDRTWHFYPKIEYVNMAKLFLRPLY